MFDRSGFDRGTFDRFADNNSIEPTLSGNGNLKINAVFRTDLTTSMLAGSGDVTGKLIAITNIYDVGFEGGAEGLVDDFGDRLPALKVDKLMFDLNLNTKLSGQGDVTCELILATPLGPIEFSGQGALNKFDLIRIQWIEDIRLTGEGTINSGLVKLQPIASDMSGEGGIDYKNYLLLPINVSSDLSGEGELRARVNSLDEDVFELDGFSLRPGQIVIIDTDLLDVTIDGILDVNSVTNDSIFFQLQPGHNEIFVECDKAFNFQTTIIYQNRWL